MPVSKSPYIPAFLRSAISGTRPLTMRFSEVSDTNILSTSSFAYDPANSALKSTQQLNVDWSQFENHTFFSSAEANVNMAFDQIINNFPYDGTRVEVERFFENLTGFEKWVFDQFPRYHGALHFSGSWIVVKDFAGSLYPEISSKRSGESVLNPRNGKSLSIEMQLYLPTIANGNQIICQKLSGSNHGFSLHLSASVSTGSCVAEFAFLSGSRRLKTEATLTKGEYSHVCVVFNREEATPFLDFYVNEELVNTSRTRYQIGDLAIDSTDFTIGTGSAVELTTTFTPTETFSGSIDELRVFHEVRTVKQQRAYAQKSIYSTPNLKLYYRFNEPKPLLGANLTDSVNSIVLDSSGNSLHSLITNFTGTLREDFEDHSENPMIYERSGSYPILFSTHEDVVALNERLLHSASLYDAENPNLITRLIPQHYLEEGAGFEGFENFEGTVGETYSGEGMPGQGKMGSQQIVLTFLYIWAKFFDEIKLYIDSFSNLKYVDYETDNTIPDNFLPMLVKQFGFYMPPLFNNSTIEQYIDGENIGQDVSAETYPLKYVQQQLMRRVLTNMPDVIKSKGTQHSIKSFLRAIGIDPENSVRIREYGGPTTRQLQFAREFKREQNYMVEFYSASSLANSPFLSASRVEIGFPRPAGSFTNQSDYPPYGISNNASDGLLTSGSWTIEGIVKWPPSVISSLTSTTQSLVRLLTTGTLATYQNGVSSGSLVLNLLAVSSSRDPRMILFVRPHAHVSASHLELQLPFHPSASIFNGDHWNFAIGCVRADELGSTAVSSSYFIRVGQNEDGQMVNYYSTSSFYEDHVSSMVNVLRQLTASYNASGSKIAVGYGSTIVNDASSMFLNAISDGTARETSFSGWMSNLRFWSKALTEPEFIEHVRNHRSMGVEDPLTNWNYGKTNSGSFGRLRMDTFTKQTTTSTSNGNINFLDYSQNNMHMTGTGFTTTQSVLRGETFSYSYLSPYYDDASTNEKIRIRGFEDPSLFQMHPWAQPAPVYEVPRSEQPTDDVRFAVEFSLVDALNRDIVNIFATFDALDNALGDPSLLYSPDYPDLERLRDLYFQRLSQKLNFKQFFEFFKWFDASIGTFIEQLIPRKATFRGTNFLVESHMLERHKLEYYSQQIYLGDTERRVINNLLLQLIAGSIRKY